MRMEIIGGIYHIIQRGNNFEPIFVDDDDRLYFLHSLKESAQKYKFDVFSFCLMDNHIHILLRLSEKNLSKSMHSLFMRYAKRFTDKYARKGHLFTSRFRSILCANREYFLHLSRYIHVNPVKANICANPFLYRWSSCNLFAEYREANKSFVDVNFTLSFFSKNIKKAVDLYVDFVNGVVKDADGLEYPGIIVDNVLGNVYDVEMLKKFFPNLGEINKSILESIKRNESVFRDYIKGKKNIKIAGREYLIYHLKKSGCMNKDIALKLNVSERTIVRAINKVDKWISSYRKK